MTTGRINQVTIVCPLGCSQGIYWRRKESLFSTITPPLHNPKGHLYPPTPKHKAGSGSFPNVERFFLQEFVKIQRKKPARVFNLA